MESTRTQPSPSVWQVHKPPTHNNYLPFGYAKVPRLISGTHQREQTIVGECSAFLANGCDPTVLCTVVVDWSYSIGEDGLPSLLAFELNAILGFEPGVWTSAFRAVLQSRKPYTASRWLDHAPDVETSEFCGLLVSRRLDAASYELCLSIVKLTHFQYYNDSLLTGGFL